jgi:hypothetical protein
MKAGSWRLMPGPLNVTTVCGTAENALRRLGCPTSATGAAGLGRQSAKRLIEQFAERSGIDIAHHGDPQRILASTRRT